MSETPQHEAAADPPAKTGDTKDKLPAGPSTISTEETKDASKDHEGPVLNQLLHPVDTSAQWLFSQADMNDTPSILIGGLDMEQERISRWKGVQLLFSIGDYMRLHNHVTTTASIFFHRFFMRKAMPKDPRERVFDTFPFFELAPTCIFLACKVEETHRKLHHVIEATMAVLDRTAQGQELAEARAYQANKNSREYWRWKDLILLNEERLLEALCFDLIVEQAHPIAIKAAKRLGAPRSLAQLTVIYCNCLLYGAVCIFYDAPILAACAFAKACEAAEVDPMRFNRSQKIGDEEGLRKWYDVFGVDEDEIKEAIEDISSHMRFHDERLFHTVNKQQQQGSTPLHQPVSAPRSSLPTPLGSHGEIDSPLRHSVISSALPPPPRPSTLSPPPFPATTLQNAETKPQVSFVSPPAAESNARVGNDHETAVRPPSRHGNRGLGPPPPLMGAARRHSLSIENAEVEEEKANGASVTPLEERDHTENADVGVLDDSAEEGEV